MAKNPKTKHTQINDLSVSEKELTATEAGKIKGGGKPTKEQTPTAIIEPPPLSAAMKAGEPKKDKDLSAK